MALCMYMDTWSCKDILSDGPNGDVGIEHPQTEPSANVNDYIIDQPSSAEHQERSV